MQKLKEECLKPEYAVATYERFIGKNIKDKSELIIIHSMIEEMIEDLFAGKYTWSVPELRLINKSGTTKKRKVYIYSLKDRFLLGVLYRAFSSYFRDKINKHCFSYRSSVSTNTAIKYIASNLDKGLTAGVKVDIHAYFNSVSKERVQEMLDELFTGNIKTELESLMFDERITYRGEEKTEYKSLIAGCALASFFANYCLSPLDKALEDKGALFARYSDDIIVLGKDLEDVKDSLNIITSYLDKYGLELNPDKYKWFSGTDDFEFLGLKLSQDKTIDISDHAKKKIKRQIKRWCDKGRKSMEMQGKDFYTVARGINKRLNNKNFKCYINNEASFGWCHYAFRYITTEESLKEIDKYTKDTLRAMKTGKHNKANYKALTEEDFKAIGWVSLVQLYHLYKKDFDYYCEVIELL
jgi:retron-type reverse transcriptase